MESAAAPFHAPRYHERRRLRMKFLLYLAGFTVADVAYMALKRLLAKR